MQTLIRSLNHQIDNTVKYILLLLIFVCPGTSWPQVNPVPSSEVKAVFLFNFANFVDWPSTSLLSPGEPFIIGVLGENPFGSYLEKSVLNEKKDGHPLVIKYFSNIEEAKNCRILFINLQSPEQLHHTLMAIKGLNILTVSDAPEFAKSGGMIRFFIVNNKVRFQVNMEAVKDANLVISSKMLRLAEVLNSEGP